MSIGRQKNFFKIKSQHRYSYGGVLRNKRLGRGQRPLPTREPIHVVFKINKNHYLTKSLRSPKCFALIQRLLKKYSIRFFVKVEQASIQHDHLHLLLRAPRRCQIHHFFRVFAGQISQQLQAVIEAPSQRVTGTPEKSERKKSLWKYRPFSRVVKSYRAYKIVRDYIQLNEQEALGKISYQKNRLRGLSSGDWTILWT